MARPSSVTSCTPGNGFPNSIEEGGPSRMMPKSKGSSVGDGVADLVDLAHSAGAEDTCNFVVADLVSDLDGHALCPFYGVAKGRSWRASKSGCS